MILSKFKRKVMCAIIGVSLIGLNCGVGFSTEELKQTKNPKYTNRMDIPSSYKWNLKEIYQNISEWESDFKKTEELLNSFTTNRKGTLGNSETAFEEAMLDFEIISKVATKVYVYAKLSYDVNMSDSSAQDLMGKATNLITLYSEKTSWFVPEVNSLNKETIEKYLNSPRLSLYKSYINDIMRTATHTLSAENEEILARMIPINMLPSESFRLLSKDISFGKVKNDNNEDVELNSTTLVPLLQSQNDEVRKSAFKQYYGTMKKFGDTFAKLLSGSVKSDNINANIRKYESALESSLYPNNIDIKVYDQLIKTVNDNLNLMNRYIEDKKISLKTPNLHMYDIYLTSGGESSLKYISFDDAKEIVLKALEPMGNEYISVLKEAFDNNWVDVYSTSDKVPGGYQMSMFDLHPYILLNYQGTMQDVYTLAHELGHAMQSYYTNKKQPYIYSNYPVFTAEVASTLNETLLSIYLLNNSKTLDEKKYVINKNLESFRSTLFRQTMFAEFEKTIHEKDKLGETLNAKTLNQIYLDLNKKYYGDGIVSDEEIAMEWARIPHFYNSFYVYQYATSFSAASSIAKTIIEQGDPAVKKVIANFLSAGSSNGPIEVLKDSGVDMSTPQPIKDTMKIFELVLDEFESLISDNVFSIEVDGIKMDIPIQEKLLINGRSYAFMDNILHNMGAKIESDAKRVVIKLKNTTLIYETDSNYVTLNNSKIFLEQPTKIVSGKILLPLRYTMEILGANVGWNNGIISIQTKS